MLTKLQGVSREIAMGAVKGPRGKYAVPLSHVVDECVTKWSEGFLDLAAQKDSDAMVMVAQMHLKEDGWGKVEPSEKKGLRLLTKAVKARNPMALDMLDRMKKDRSSVLYSSGADAKALREYVPRSPTRPRTPGSPSPPRRRFSTSRTPSPIASSSPLPLPTSIPTEGKLSMAQEQQSVNQSSENHHSRVVAEEEIEADMSVLMQRMRAMRAAMKKHEENANLK